MPRCMRVHHGEIACLGPDIARTVTSRTARCQVREGNSIQRWPCSLSCARLCRSRLLARRRHGSTDDSRAAVAAATRRGACQVPTQPSYPPALGHVTAEKIRPLLLLLPHQARRRRPHYRKHQKGRRRLASPYFQPSPSYSSVPSQDNSHPAPFPMKVALPATMRPPVTGSSYLAAPTAQARPAATPGDDAQAFPRKQGGPSRPRT